MGVGVLVYGEQGYKDKGYPTHNPLWEELVLVVVAVVVMVVVVVAVEVVVVVVVVGVVEGIIRILFQSR